MSHSIQAIIASPPAAGALRGAWPAIPLAPLRQGFVAFPMSAALVDARAGPGESAPSGGFQLLTAPFRDLLHELSRSGPLAYVETDDFGGLGAQGAAAYSGGETLMEPEWRERGPINRALKWIGVRRRPLGDRFAALGLADYRSNDAFSAAPGRPRGERRW